MGIMKLKCRKSIIMEEIRYVQNRYEKIREEKIFYNVLRI